MADFIISLPMWLIKTLAVTLGLGLAALTALFISRLFFKLYGQHPRD